MITVVCGLPGVGKSSLMVKFMRDIYFTEGRALLKQSQSQIMMENMRRQTPLTLPTKVPIYSDYEVTFKVGYEKFFSTYFINGFYYGMKNNDVETIPVVPCSKVFLSEVQRYYDSRKSKSLPDWVSRNYEMHRHYGLDVYMDLQRIGLLDLNIRDLSARIIEVCKMEHEYNSQGFIAGTTWTCHEFDNWETFDSYLNGKKVKVNTVKHVYRGNIFKTYNSYAYQSEFFPDEENDFLYLEHKGQVGSVAYVQEKLRKYYEFSMPDGYRNGGEHVKRIRSA